jgi:hypothetical protein
VRLTGECRLFVALEAGIVVEFVASQPFQISLDNPVE